jgi:RNase adapter protein RapZ
MSDTPILLVTGLSGAGKSTVLRTLEDLGWEVVDNLPLLLLDRLLETALPAERDLRPLAVGFGPQTRGFNGERIVKRIKRLREEHGDDVGTLFLDCAESELARRYSETRRRHPLAVDRPASDGIARERELMMPLRRWANRVIDTTTLSSNDLAAKIRETFGGREGLGEPVVTVMSFGFARGLPQNADLVFDMRFLRNPHWVAELRPGTGLDAPVADYVRGDPAYAAVDQIEDLLLTLIPRYRAEGKSYVTIGVGCTGGRHRSVHVAERIAGRLRKAGFSPTVTHRDLGTAPQDSLEGTPAAR